MTYLTEQQVNQLLKPINGRRVGKDGKGFSHVEAYDIRAHLNRIFGFARWSDEVTRLNLVFETVKEGYRKRNKQGEEYGDPYDAWTVCYSATVRITVHAPDGTVLASYEDGATGDSTNQQSQSDAHDMALKTALSQAFKRAAVNLGDQYGLSLYAKGSLSAIVARTLVEAGTTDGGDPIGEAVDPTLPVDAHITDQLPAEDATPEVVPETRERSSGTPAADMSNVNAAAIYARYLVGPDGPSIDKQKWIGSLIKEASTAKCLASTVDTDDGPMVLKHILEQALVTRAA